MIHVGAVAGAAISQGRTATFGFDTSWTKFQDLRNDRSKRDFVTFGAAAGVAAAFSAPIGGVLFTLEEGASYWSTNLTFRAFFCAMITQLTLNLLYSGFQLGRDHADGLFAFGLFTDFSGYATFELFIFILMGAGGGVMGAFFVHLSHRMAVFRQEHITTNWKRAIELLVVTTVMTVIIFVVPLMWATCTAVPTDTADWTDQEVNLLDKLVKYQCSDNQYNQVASLYFVPADVALQQLFHFKESGGTTYTTFDTGALLMFFIPYSAMAVIAAGLIVPSGIFVPSLLAGGAYGRIVGHILNIAFPGYVTDSGTYALIGGAAMMGGVSRMTMAGTIIMLEASGNSEYLLPLMLTFAAARYTGNAMSEPLYDMFIRFKHLPFLENSLKTLGLLNYHPVVEVMAQPVITLNEINRVGDVHRILSTLSHNGFPVVGKTGHLRGLILRKHLCTLIKLKAFSAPTAAGQLAPAATVFHDTLERTYPNYPRVEDINLTPAEMVPLLLLYLVSSLRNSVQLYC
jgi:chloride channel 7